MTVLATCADRAECALEIRKHGGLRSLVSLLLAKDEYIQQVAALAVGSCADKGDNAAEVPSSRICFCLLWLTKVACAVDSQLEWSASAADAYRKPGARDTQRMAAWARCSASSQAWHPPAAFSSFCLSLFGLCLFPHSTLSLLRDSLSGSHTPSVRTDANNRTELRRLGGLRVVVGLLATRDDELQERAALLFGNCTLSLISSSFLVSFSPLCARMLWRCLQQLDRRFHVRIVCAGVDADGSDAAEIEELGGMQPLLALLGSENDEVHTDTCTDEHAHTYTIVAWC